MKPIKIFIAISLVFAVFCGLVSVDAGGPDEVGLQINGENKDIQPKILKSGETVYIPIIALTKFLYGSYADYSYAAKKIIAVNRYGSVFENKINTDVISVNGGKLKTADSSMQKSGDFYVTDEFLRIVFGIGCTYGEKTNTLYIWQTSETDTKKLPPEICDLGEAMLLRHYQPEYLERYIKYKKNNPALDYFDVVTYVNIGLDFPHYSGIITKEPKNLGSALVLCNKYSRLPADYIPEGYKKTDGRVLSLVGEAQEQFEKMRADATKVGISLYIVSGYRSYAVQEQIYNNYKKTDPNGADTYSARPGHSEHQTGLAADINAGSLSAHFEKTKEYAWLVENAHKYGFILRYPKGKEWITGYTFEPWHWRYLGAKIAQRVRELEITYDEYCAIYRVPQNARALYLSYHS
ncbi:MAG: M15 family metallopeptidase [Oscillospiraceae bacterium]|nr:M15 family metallopeptidase [Oscillospiraceae bacterium]